MTYKPMKYINKPDLWVKIQGILYIKNFLYKK